MISSSIIYLAFFLYMYLMYIIAKWGDRQNLSQRKVLRMSIYSFSLAVYCTSWTYFGAVGTAANTGWGYLPIYLGPIILFLLGWPLIHKFIKISKEKNVTSIADFVASLYEKSRRLAVLVTLIAVIASVPYIALQMEAISASLEAVSTDNHSAHLRTFIIAVMLCFFAIAFGTKKLDVTEHHRGLMMAIAFESVIKLVAFITVGTYVVYYLYSGPADVFKASMKVQEIANGPTLSINFMAQVLLAFLVFMCLPRQFHTTVIENESRNDLIKARWVFVAYLIIFSIFVIPISMAGNTWLGDSVPSDMYVLELPMHMNNKWLTLLVLFGGIAAATGMVIISTIALSTMVSNDLLLPIYLRIRQYSLPKKLDMQRAVLYTRRASIISITLMGYLVYYFLDHDIPLSSFGNLSFLLTVQFAPAILLGIYWQKSNKQAAFAGILSGVMAWVLFVFNPQFLFTDYQAHPSMGLIYTLQNLNGNSTSLTKLIIFSLGMNLLTHLIVSWVTGYYRNKYRGNPSMMSENGIAESIKVRDLKATVAKIIGPKVMQQSYQNFFQGFNTQVSDSSDVSTPIIQFTERLLSGSIGSSSARTVLTALLKRKGLTVNDIVGLLDETSEAIRFQRRMTDATLDSISQGVSVVDRNLRLVAWNKQYMKLLNYPDGMIYKGMPIEELIRFNASRGLLGERDIAKEVEKRLVHLRKRIPYMHEKAYENSRYLRIEGNPMPDGGYVTTYTDVSHYKQIEQKLRKSEKDIRFYTDNSPAMLAYVDNSYVLKFANKAYLRFFSDNDSSVVGNNIDEICMKSDFDKCKSFLQQALAGHSQSFELELKDAKNFQHFVLGNYVADIDESSKTVKGVFVILQDISSRRQTELELKRAKENLEIRVDERTREIVKANKDLEVAKQKAEDANSSKTKFIADASHDLLQPFNAARLFSSLLTEKSSTLPEDIRQTIANLDNSLKYAENFLAALLDIAKIDAGGITIEKNQVSINQMFEHLHNQYQSLANRKGLKFKVRKNNFYACTDKKLLYRVLQNLTNNALKYTEKGGVLLRCRKHRNNLEIYVIDTGVGMTPEEQKQIFQDFFRLNKISSKDERGLGLGLSIVDRIIHQLGHDLTITSIVGKGSTFKLTVPVLDAKEVVEEINDPRTSIKNDKQPQILCIDNEPQILQGMKQLISNWGHIIKCAESGKQAEELMNSGFKPHILLVDYHLDSESGLDVIERLFNKFGFSCPVVIITANRTEELKQEIELLKYNILLKPIKPAILRNVINRLS